MAAPKNNQYWKLAKSWGSDKIYSPDTLWLKALEYFEWVENNPLKEEKVFSSGVKIDAAKLRAMTVKAFCIFAQISTMTFYRYEKNQQYTPITDRIKDIIYAQKFEGAAAGLFETNIIARELGLADAQKVSVTDNNAIVNSELNQWSDEALEELQKLKERERNRTK